jgi:hypothetical protein
MKLIIHLHLGLRLGMHGALLSQPLCISMTLNLGTETPLPLLVYSVFDIKTFVVKFC